LKENGGKAVGSENALGLTYKPNASWMYEVRASYATDFSSSDNTLKPSNPTGHIFFYSEQSLWSSAPISVESRYYVPTSELAREVKSNGMLRTQSFINWEYTENFNMDYMLQTRFYFFKEDAANGGDASFRFTTGPYLNYKLTKALTGYYLPSLDTMAGNFSRGDFNADGRNSFVQEVGLIYSVGNFVINPCWVTDASTLNKGTYAGAGDDQNSEYNLIVQAYF